MLQKKFNTEKGSIAYWINDFDPRRHTLVFLPGLTADHRLFEKQIDDLENSFNILVWDAPGHGASRPFRMDFSLDDKARFLWAIFQREQIKMPVIVGQSMGGYVAQCYMELFPGTLGGFISIDSAPLKRKYVTAAEILMLKHMGPVYRAFPRKLLLKSGSEGVAVSEYGQKLMLKMMLSYSGDEYAELAGHGFKILAEAMEKKRRYQIDCPCLLLCGKEDRAGSAKSYNRRWAEEEDLPIIWLRRAGHNSNTDVPELVNGIIRNFMSLYLETICI